jgi:Family of unknown function (DUF6281)
VTESTESAYAGCEARARSRSGRGGRGRHGPRGEPSSESDLATSCAALIEFEGRLYIGNGVEVAPIEGPVLGTGVRPSCDDIPEEPVTVAAIEGVPPDIAVMVSGEIDHVFVPHQPRELTRLFDAPRCSPRTVPFVLEGPWLGIIGTDGRGDPEPPYGLELFVESTSAPRYARAFLTVRVPRSLGRPLTREDIRRSLWQGGTIRIGTRCGLRGRYVALSVKAFPPA